VVSIELEQRQRLSHLQPKLMPTETEVKAVEHFLFDVVQMLRCAFNVLGWIEGQEHNLKLLQRVQHDNKLIFLPIFDYVIQLHQYLYDIPHDTVGITDQDIDACFEQLYYSIGLNLLLQIGQN
jgi:hypothetical protein